MTRLRLLAASALAVAVAAGAAAQAQTPRAATPMTPVSPQSPASPTAPPTPTPTAPTTAAGQPTTGTATDAAPGPAPSTGPYQPITAGSDVASTLKASGQFTTLLKLADATSLTQVLGSPGLTVFAPTDAAFAASGIDTSDTALKDQAALQKIQGALTYHVVNAKIPPFKGRQASVTAANGQKLYLDGTGDAVKVNDATAQQPAVTVGSSTIYVIDKVVSPGFTPPTPPAAEPEAAPAAAEKATTTRKTTTTRKKR